MSLNSQKTLFWCLIILTTVTTTTSLTSTSSLVVMTTDHWLRLRSETNRVLLRITFRTKESVFAAILANSWSPIVRLSMKCFSRIWVEKKQKFSRNGPKKWSLIDDSDTPVVRCRRRGRRIHSSLSSDLRLKTNFYLIFEIISEKYFLLQIYFWIHFYT